MATTAVLTHLPSREEMVLARVCQERLAPLARLGRPLAIHLRTEDREEVVELPARAVQLLSEILEDMASGHAVAVVPQDAELTTQQAADLLNVSRPFLVRLLEEGKIPFRKVGAHRRVRLDDILRYRKESEMQSRKGLDEITAISEELGLYDR